MNRWQNLRQIAYLLRSVAWPSGSAGRVLADAIVSASEATRPALTRGSTFAVVRPLGAERDQDQPGRSATARYEVTLVTSVQDRATNQGSVIGANATDLGSSSGRGVEEVADAIEGALSVLTPSSSGLQARGVRRDDPRPASDDESLLETPFELEVTDEVVARSYAPARWLAAVGGVGQVALSWRIPPDRFDRFRMVLRRAAGATPPASPSSGSGVALSGDLASSVTDAGLAAGTYAYALFAAYDDLANPPGTPAAVERSYSPAATCVAVVT